jgi:hypothetical protein
MAARDAGPYTPFPLCLEVLMGVFDNIVAGSADTYMGAEWARTKERYRQNRDCVALMNYAAFKLTYFAEHMRDRHDKLPGLRDVQAVVTECPGEHVRTLVSPNGETDWSRAVWCIYWTVQQQGFGNAWNADVLAQMEGWLAAWTRSFPAKPASGGPGLGAGNGYATNGAVLGTAMRLMGRAKDAADAADEVAEALRRDGAGWRGGGSDAQAAAAGEASRPAAAAEKMREMLAELLALYGKYATEAK